MDIKIRSRQDITIIDFEGTEIDHKNTSFLSEKILSLIKEEEVKNIALNLEKISWLTSSGIGALLNIRKSINKADGELCIFNINPQVLESIKVLMIDRILPVFNDEEEAVDYLKSTPWSKAEKVYEVRKLNGISLIDIKEQQLDLQNSGDIESKCLELVEKEKIEKIAINFEKVSFITSSGIGALLSIYNCTTNNNAKMCVYNLCQDILEALEISMVDKILNIVSDEKSAIELLNS
ncbi:MAG: STAS domain-containing protein [Cyanobacteriota bacterium]